jgi:hypothetical protein
MDEHFNTGPAQFGLDLDDSAPAKFYEPDRDEIRQELNEILMQARDAANSPPWDERTFQYNKVVFPQMANWLPEDERDQLRLAFAKEVERIEMLMAV